MAFIGSIIDRAVGDDWRIRKSTSTTVLGDEAERAWLYIKADLFTSDADAIVTREITEQDDPGVGQIESTGANGQPVELRFDVNRDVTADASQLQSHRSYAYVVRVLAKHGLATTIEKGVLIPQ